MDVRFSKKNNHKNLLENWVGWLRLGSGWPQDDVTRVSQSGSGRSSLENLRRKGMKMADSEIS